MYNLPLNSPELKEMRNRVRYNVTCKKNSELLEVIDHESHKTLIPQFNYDHIESSNVTDVINQHNLITIEDTGYLNFKTDTEEIITDPNDYGTAHYETTESTYTYHLFITYRKATGEITGNIPFTYHDKKYTSNPDGYYIIKEDNP